MTNNVPVYVALLHEPMVNRHGARVTTAVTNLDLHDISRTSKTYGARGFFVATPLEEQHRILERILSHWSDSRTREAHPDRGEAVALIRRVRSFEEVKAAIEAECGSRPFVVLTDARKSRDGEIRTSSYGEFRRLLESQAIPKNAPLLLVFGTGWGIAPEFYSEVHLRLDPIYGSGGEGGYNHLSVRAAAAAVMDRLFGQ